MPFSLLIDYKKTAISLAILVLAILYSYSDLRVETWVALEGFFRWMETTWFGQIGQSYGSVFALVQSLHLLSMAGLGGAVIAGDGRLLGLIFRDVPAHAVLGGAHRVFVWSLLVVVITGVFMACGVATKLYYLPVFWFKMLSLAAGTLFYFLLRRPLLQRNLEEVNPVTLRMVALAHILVWFMVAATGRWIGFSG